MSTRVKKEINPTPYPGMMKIMSSVAEAAGLSIHDIMSEQRVAGVIHARTAIYKLATSYGYSKDDIAYFLDRSRRVAYNYEANLDGHLRRNKEFKQLLEKAKQILAQHRHREIWHPSRAPMEPAPKPEPATKSKEPEFKDTQLKTGWFFTAEENRKAWLAIKGAEEFFKTYGKAPRMRIGTQAARPRRNDTPTEMPTADAVEYLQTNSKILTRGVELGYLHRFKKPGSTAYWYKTDELDKFQDYLAKNNKNPLNF